MEQSPLVDNVTRALLRRQSEGDCQAVGSVERSGKRRVSGVSGVVVVGSCPVERCSTLHTFEIPLLYFFFFFVAISSVP